MVVPPVTESRFGAPDDRDNSALHQLFNSRPFFDPLERQADSFSVYVVGRGA